MLATCWRHVADVSKCRQFLPKMRVGADTKTPPTLNFVSAFSQHSTTYQEATYAQTPIPRTYVRTKIRGKHGGRAAARARQQRLLLAAAGSASAARWRQESPRQPPPPLFGDRALPQWQLRHRRQQQWQGNRQQSTINYKQRQQRQQKRQR